MFKNHYLRLKRKLALEGKKIRLKIKKSPPSKTKTKSGKFKITAIIKIFEERDRDY